MQLPPEQEAHPEDPEEGVNPLSLLNPHADMSRVTLVPLQCGQEIWLSLEKTRASNSRSHPLHRYS